MLKTTYQRGYSNSHMPTAGPSARVLVGGVTGRRLVLRVLRVKTPPYIHSILSSMHISYALHTHLICVSATSHSTTLIHCGKPVTNSC